VRAAAAAPLLGCVLLAASPAPAADALDGLPALSPGTLRVYLVRHGQALSNLDPAPDLPPEQLDHLTALGTRQADAVGRALARRSVSSVYASPAARARETAEVVSRTLGVAAPGVEPRLRPMALGRAPGGRMLAWKERAVEWEAGRDPSPADGESMERVGDRVSELVQELARGRRGTSVVLVAHGEVIGAYLGRIRGTPPAKRYPPGLGTGAIAVVDVAASGAEAIRLTSHTPAAP
jgi:probable phosphoglycerate mutase